MDKDKPNKNTKEINKLTVEARKKNIEADILKTDEATKAENSRHKKALEDLNKKKKDLKAKLKELEKKK